MHLTSHLISPHLTHLNSSHLISPPLIFGVVFRQPQSLSLITCASFLATSTDLHCAFTNCFSQPIQRVSCQLAGAGDHLVRGLAGPVLPGGVPAPQQEQSLGVRVGAAGHQPTGADLGGANPESKPRRCKRCLHAGGLRLALETCGSKLCRNGIYNFRNSFKTISCRFTLLWGGWAFSRVFRG